MSELTDRLREQLRELATHLVLQSKAPNGPPPVQESIPWQAADALDRMEARIAELEGALRPFAEVGQGETHFYILPETLEAARRALSEGEG